MDADTISVEAADVRHHESAWRRLRRNWSVRLGGAVPSLRKR